MKISQKIVDDVLVVYYPNYRYLKEAEVDYPVGRGRFQIGETEYIETSQYVTDFEAQLCLNQLCYVFFGQCVIDKRWEGLEDLTFDKYLDLRKENMFIIESHKKFRRETNQREPFYGQIELMKVRRQGNIYITKLDFSLNDGACVGELSLVLKG